MDRCVNCHKLKPVFMRVEGQTKKVWCGSGTYQTRTVYWCEECWRAQEAFEAESRARQEAKTLAEVQAALLKAGITQPGRQ